MVIQLIYIIKVDPYIYAYQHIILKELHWSLYKKIMGWPFVYYIFYFITKKTHRGQTFQSYKEMDDIEDPIKVKVVELYCTMINALDCSKIKR